MSDAQLAPFTELLLKHGANPSARASLRKRLNPGYIRFGCDAEMHEYRDVTPLSWGRRFQCKIFVSEPAMRLIAKSGGKE